MKNLRSLAIRTVQSGRNKAAAAGAMLMLIGIQANAASSLPAEATAAITQVGDNASSIISGFWPVVASVAVGFKLYSLFKRGVSKS